MIWTLSAPADLLPAFTPAGEPDQAVIDAYTSAHQKRQHAPAAPGVKRWYYVLSDNPRVSLATVGMPLEAWTGGAYLIVGTREIIGEFAGNRHLVGKRGLQMKMQPLTWMTGTADKDFASAEAMLAEISEQILDLPQIEQAQHWQPRADYLKPWRIVRRKK